MADRTEKHADTEPQTLLIEALRENLSPHAVAAIASYTMNIQTDDIAVNGEVAWFVERLTELVGGWKQQGVLAEEIGL